MKIKCTNLTLDSKKVFYTGASNGSLTVGKEYLVLTFFIKSNFAGFRIECDDGELIIPDADQFEVLSRYIPSNWEAKVYTFASEEGSSYSLTLAPQKWNEAMFNIGTPKEQGFYEEIVLVDGPLEDWRKYPKDQLPQVVKLYFQEKDIIYSEEEAYEKARSSGFSKPSSILLELIKGSNSTR